MLKKLRKFINAVLGIDGNKITKEIEDISWGLRFQSLTMGSSWYKGGVYAGGWAVGYPFLCVLYRVLDEIRPGSILELGLGQSTKMTTGYVKSSLNAHNVVHNIVEHDEEWIEFMRNSVDYTKSNLIILPLIQKEYKGSSVTGYEGFYDNICVDYKYELILIDGPFGGLGEFSRIDVLTHVPEILAEDFIIMVDDTEREGDKNMCSELCNVLQTNNIKYVCEEYKGVKNITVIASPSHKFVCSMI